MIKYAQFKDGAFIPLRDSGKASINGHKYRPEYAATKPKITGTYEIGEYDSENYYPHNFELVNGVLECDLIPKNWEHPDKSIRIMYSQNIPWIKEFAQFYMIWILTAYLRRMRIEPNHVETVNKMYSNSFNPPSLEAEIMGMADVGYKCDETKKPSEAWSIAPKGTEGYTDVWGDPHKGGLIIIERLVDLKKRHNGM